MDLISLAEYGVVGIALACIALVALIINKVFKFMDNHVNHNTEALTKLNEKIKQDIKVGEETHKLLRNLNGKK